MDLFATTTLKGIVDEFTFSTTEVAELTAPNIIENLNYESLLMQ
ncbi:hypothetical protein [Nostoc sp.]